MKITKILPDVLHIDFDRIWYMSKYLGRMQEYAEHPKFYKKVFTTSRVKKYYRNLKEHFRTSSYGFNIPGWAFKAFWDKKFTPTESESEMLKVLESHGYGPDSLLFYVIASAGESAVKESLSAMDHEIAHALFYICPDYKNEILMVMARYPEEVERVRKVISEWSCYHPSVFEDECHAYLATESVSRLQGRFKLKDVTTLHDEMNKIFQNYKEKLSNKLQNTSIEDTMREEEW